MLVDYPLLSESAKVWIYPSNRKFYKDEINVVVEKVKTFVSEWKKEEEDFQASYQFLYDRFIVIFAQDDEGKLSNTDVDELVGFIFKLQDEFDVELLDRMNVCFKQGEYVQYKEIKEFKKLLKNKSVSNKTVVFDNLVQNKDEFENHWEVPITESWYNRFL